VSLAAFAEQPSHHGMSLEQYYVILRAYWKPIAAITLLITAVGAVIIKFLPHTYIATATLIVNSDVKDPLAGRDIPMQVITDYVSTQIELMTSPIVLQPALQQLKLMQDKDFTGGFTGSGAALQEVVERNLAAAIQVERGVGGQLLYVSASARTAAKAADIANTVTDVYIAQDRRRLNDPATERAQRYTEELAELREKVSIAQDKVTAFGKANEIDDLNSGSANTEAQALDVLQQRLLETQNLRRSLEAKQAGPPSVDGPNGTATTVLSTQTTLDSQLAQLAQLKNLYGPQHPKIVELNAQIALTRQALADEKRALSANIDSQLTQAKSLERKYQQAIAAQEAKVLKVREAQAEGSKLLLELDSAKAVYKQALDGFDQIMFQAVANHTNVSVVSPAVPPLRPSKPNKLKLLLVVIGAALVIGIGAPFGYGLFVARRLRCRDDLERDFGIPVLAELKPVAALRRTATSGRTT
jgi:uncharacterized protein involved in exopolysaccharide biosynthesis